MRFRQRPACPLMAISGHAEGSGRESALPPKADTGSHPREERAIIQASSGRCHRRPPGPRFPPRFGGVAGRSGSSGSVQGRTA